MKLGGKTFNHRDAVPASTTPEGEDKQAQTSTPAWVKPKPRHTFPVSHPYWKSIANPVPAQAAPTQESEPAATDHQHTTPSGSTANKQEPIELPPAQSVAKSTTNSSNIKSPVKPSAQEKSKAIRDAMDLTPDMKAVFKIIMPKIAGGTLSISDVTMLKVPEQISLLASIAAKIAARRSANEQHAGDEHAEVEHLASHWRATNTKTLVAWLNDTEVLMEMRQYVITEGKIQWGEDKMVMETLGDALGKNYSAAPHPFQAKTEHLIDMIHKGGALLYPHDADKIQQHTRGITTNQARTILLQPEGLKKFMTTKNVNMMYDPPTWALIGLSEEMDPQLSEADKTHGRANPASTIGITMRDVNRYITKEDKHAFLMQMCSPYILQYFAEDREGLDRHLRCATHEEIMVLLLNESHLIRVALATRASLHTPPPSNATSSTPDHVTGTRPPATTFFYRMGIKSDLKKGGSMIPVSVLRRYWIHLAGLVGEKMRHHIELVPFNQVNNIKPIDISTDMNQIDDAILKEYVGKITLIRPNIRQGYGMKPTKGEPEGIWMDVKLRSTLKLGKLRTPLNTPHKLQTEHHLTFLKEEGLFTKIRATTILGQRPLRIFLNSSPTDDPRRVKHELLSSMRAAGNRVSSDIFDVKYATIKLGKNNTYVSGIYLLAQPEDDDDVLQFLSSMKTNNKEQCHISHDYIPVPAFLGEDMALHELEIEWEKQATFLRARSVIEMEHIPSEIDAFEYIPKYSFLPDDTDINEAPLINILCMGTIEDNDGVQIPSPFSKMFRNKQNHRWTMQYNMNDKHKVQPFYQWSLRATDKWSHLSANPDDPKYTQTPPASRTQSMAQNTNESTVLEDEQSECSTNDLDEHTGHDDGSENDTQPTHTTAEEHVAAQPHSTAHSTTDTAHLEQIIEQFLVFQKALVDEQTRKIHSMSNKIDALQEEIAQISTITIPPTVEINDQVSQVMSEVTLAINTISQTSQADSTKMAEMRDEIRNGLEDTKAEITRLSQDTSECFKTFHTAITQEIQEAASDAATPNNEPDGLKSLREDITQGFKEVKEEAFRRAKEDMLSNRSKPAGSMKSKDLLIIRSELTAGFANSKSLAEEHDSISTATIRAMRDEIRMQFSQAKEHSQAKEAADRTNKDQQIATILSDPMAQIELLRTDMTEGFSATIQAVTNTSHDTDTLITNHHDSWKVELDADEAANTASQVCLATLRCDLMEQHTETRATITNNQDESTNMSIQHQAEISESMQGFMEHQNLERVRTTDTLLVLIDKLSQAVGVAQDYANIADERAGLPQSFPYRPVRTSNTDATPIRLQTSTGSPCTSPPSEMRAAHDFTAGVIEEMQKLSQTTPPITQPESHKSRSATSSRYSAIAPTELFTQAPSLQPTNKTSPATKLPGYESDNNERRLVRPGASEFETTHQTSRAGMQADEESISTAEDEKKEASNPSSIHEGSQKTAATHPTTDSDDVSITTLAETNPNNMRSIHKTKQPEEGANHPARDEINASGASTPGTTRERRDRTAKTTALKNLSSAVKGTQQEKANCGKIPKELPVATKVTDTPGTTTASEIDAKSQDTAPHKKKKSALFHYESETDTEGET